MRYLGLIWANLGRNKLRTALTGGAIMLAVVLVCLLLSMPAGLNAILDHVANNARISVHAKGGLVYQMPYSFTRKVRQVDGVAAAVAQTWFGGAFEEAGRVTFPNFAVEPEYVGAVYPDYPIAPEQLADFQRYRDGAIAGRQIMHKYGWKIGDRITLRSTAWPVNLDLRIVGEIANERAPMLWLTREYLDQALKAAGRPGLGTVGIIWVRATDANRVNSIMRQIDEMSRNSEYETACETEKSFLSNFFGSLQGFVTIILIVTGLVALCIVFIAANTASMGVRERAGELAVLKAIGFGRRVIFGTLLAEAMALSAVAGGAGVVVAMSLTGALRVFAGWNDSLGPLGSFIITAPVIVQGVFLSLFVGMLAGVVPSYGAARKPVVQTLHEVF
ncbi:MAG TPA: ABC transporter permease [Candidatus Margulisiibacteriota bacterium]|nr:ABC transporter permease [Candidatus Margulisiibacteriota bacterium]